MQRDGLQIQAAVKVDSGHNVSLDMIVQPLSLSRNGKTAREGGVDEYSLQSRHNATASRGSTRCCNRSRGSSGRHPIAVRGISSIHTLRLFLRAGRGQISSATWEGQRGRCSEVASLSRGHRVSGERVHNGLSSHSYQRESSGLLRWSAMGTTD